MELKDQWCLNNSHRNRNKSNGLIMIGRKYISSGTLKKNGLNFKLEIIKEQTNCIQAISSKYLAFQVLSCHQLILPLNNCLLTHIKRTIKPTQMKFKAFILLRSKLTVEGFILEELCIIQMVTKWDRWFLVLLKIHNNLILLTKQQIEKLYLSKNIELSSWLNHVVWISLIHVRRNIVHMRCQLP